MAPMMSLAKSRLGSARLKSEQAITTPLRPALEQLDRTRRGGSVSSAGTEGKRTIRDDNGYGDGDGEGASKRRRVDDGGTANGLRSGDREADRTSYEEEREDASEEGEVEE